MAARWCVVVGDVVGSRSVDDREALRSTLESAVAAANDAAGKELVAHFAILKGVDEVAGVLHSPAGVDRVLWALVDALHPTEIRLAVVHGAVDVGTDGADVAAMDGPAFHEADRLLDAVDADDRHVGLALAEESTPVVDLLEAAVNLLVAWKYEWTERQAELVGLYREHESMTAVAEREGITVQVVSKTLDRAGARAVVRTEREIGRAFEYLTDEG